MAETYTSKYANGEAVDAALDKAESALQAADVVNALNSSETAKPLSAAQGKVLADGKVAGPASATDNAIARFDGETGKLLQDGANATLADNGALTIATGTVTDSQPVLNLSQTWNDAADTFTAIKANVTDTASASGSLLMDLQVGGASKLKVSKDGTIKSLKLELNGGTCGVSAGDGNNALYLIARNGWASALSREDFFHLNGNAYLGFSSSILSYAAELKLAMDSANVLAQRNSTNAQESRLYGSYTSATAYQRLSTKTIREAVTCASGASVTTTISIPKFTHLIGVTTRVTTAIGTTNSTTGYQVGDGTDADLWGAITGTAQGTTSDRRDFTAVDALGPDGADRTITLTAVGGNFDGTGVIEVCAYYLAAEAD